VRWPAPGPNAVVVIPARMASSRYPGKPLVPILGFPMVEHVRRRALLASDIARVVVATCDREIQEAVEAAGGHVAMTSTSHTRCIDRVEEAMIAIEADIVAIVQGDEPLLVPDAIGAVIAPLLRDDTVLCTNLLSPLESRADLGNVNIVKAVCDQSGDLMLLTRAAVPHFREQLDVPVFRQTGIMAFRTTFLHEYSRMKETPLERAESIDMLRVLENGVRIAGVVAGYPTLGVDRPEDVPLAERALRQDSWQRQLHERAFDL
jgi:3-deoxy-manno-octulosonate cytidylyltransferase (CMP-KDO synthetase)